MRMLLVLALAVFAAPDRPDPTPKGEMPPLQEQIQGEWQVVTSTTGGNPNTTITAGQALFRFDGDKMILRLKPGDREYIYQFSIESTKAPATFDFSMGKTSTTPTAGIVKIEGDVLTICYYYSSEKGRPAEFVSPAGSRSALWQMRRVKK